MKKIIIFFIILSMLCFSITGAVNSRNINNKTYENYEKLFFPEENIEHISTQKATNQIASTANAYLNLDPDKYTISQKPIQKQADVPWSNLYTGDILEWYICLDYNDEEFYREVDITIHDFQEAFLKHPEYGREMRFDIDSDPEDDVLVIIGFYWSTIMYPDGQEHKSLETRLRIRQLDSGDGIEDIDGELEVWSELHVNLGLIVDTAKSREKFESKDTTQNKLFSIFKEKINKFQNRLKNIFNLLQNFFKIREDENEKFEAADSDNDFISIGAGYRSPQGEQIPLLVEKRFAFAKGINWNSGSIFTPTIFQQQMSPGSNVVGDDVIEMLYRFRAHDAASNTDKFDVAFNVEFEPAVNLKTKFIPANGYVYYFLNIPTSGNFGGWTPRSQPTKMAFTAEINKGSGISVPKLVLELDKIDSDLAGSSGKWFSFDVNGINSFEYTASHEFNVGVTVDVPGYFSEKVEIKGFPKSVICSWGIDDLDFLITPSQFTAGLDVFTQLTMSSSIDKVTVFYPKFEGYEDAPDSPFLEVANIPSSNRFHAGGFVSIGKTSGNVLTVDVSGSTGVSSSGNINDFVVYYPKADWVNDPDIVFIDAPNGLPGSAQANARAKVRVDLDSLMDSSNYVFGRVSHDFSSNVDTLRVFLPEAELPIVKFNDIPSYGTTEGELYWGQLRGYAYSSRNSQNRDPIEINLEYGDFELYDRLEIRDGSIYTRFKVANSGYFELDTTKKMFKNDFRFNNNANGDQFLLYVDEVSADDLKTNWDISGSGEDLEINDLGFSGIIDTLKDLDISITYNGKSVTFDLDWVIGDSGHFDIEINQDAPLSLDFDQLFPQGGSYVLDGGITLENNLNFDMEWKLDIGESAQNPGYVRINKNNDENNIDVFDLYFTIKDGSGEEAYGFDIYFLDPKIYLDLEWYFDIDDIWPPYIFYWLDSNFQATQKSVRILWTDLWPGSDDYGEHHWIDIEI